MGKKSGGGAAAPAVQVPANFDPVYYLAKNPDVKAAGMDPVQHYTTYGYKEGRTYAPTQTPYGALSPEQKMATDVARSMGILNANQVATGGLLSAYLDSTGSRDAYNTQLAAAQEKARIEADPYHPSKYTTDKDLEVLRKLGINLPSTGQGETRDALARNPNLIDAYEAERRKYQPDFEYDNVAPTSVPAKEALARAQQAAQGYVSGRGLDYGEFAGDINSELDRIYKSIPYGPSVNADAYFDAEGLTGNVLSRTEANRRSQYTNQFDNMFGPTYADTAFADTFDDDILNSILEEQYGVARDRIDNQKKRGALIDTGYNAAIGDLDRQRTEASSRLQSTGGDVLAGYRGQLTDLISQGRKAASGYTLGQTFDPNTYKTQIESKKADLSGRLEGDVRSAVGPDSLFDPQRALGSGYTGQGAQNTDRQGILDVLSQRETQRRQKRGVGSQGVF